MPTGYTCYVEDGEITTLRDFALICARAFGACAELRDEKFVPGEIPQVGKKDNYHKKILKQATKEFEIFKSKSDEEIIKMLEDEYKEDYEGWMKSCEKIKLYNQRHNDMLEKVKNWNPPTNEHNGLKRFMIEQLEISISNYVPEEPAKLTLKEYKQKKISQYEWNIEYHTKELNKQLERVDGRVKWIDDLVKSVEGL